MWSFLLFLMSLNSMRLYSLPKLEFCSYLSGKIFFQNNNKPKPNQAKNFEKIFGTHNSPFEYEGK